MERHNIKSKANYRLALEEKHINGLSKQTNTKTKMRGNKNYVTQDIRF
jgi:hypothetical protein